MFLFVTKKAQFLEKLQKLRLISLKLGNSRILDLEL